MGEVKTYSMISLQREGKKDLERYMPRAQEWLTLDREFMGVFKYSSLCLFYNVFQNYMCYFFVIRQKLNQKNSQHLKIQLAAGQKQKR